METTFSLNRLWKFFKTEIYINQLRLATIPLLMPLFVFVMYMMEYDFSFVSLFIMLTPLNFYQDIHHKIKGLTYAMLPASQLEKIISSIILMNILIITLVLISFVATTKLIGIFDCCVTIPSIKQLSSEVFIGLLVQSPLYFAMLGFNKYKFFRFCLIIIPIAGIIIFTSVYDLVLFSEATKNILMKLLVFIPPLFWIATFLKFRKTQTNG